MINVCSVCSLRVKFNIDLSFNEMRKPYWIKFINKCTQRGKKNQEVLERVHERNFENSRLMRQILVPKCFYIYIKFLIYETFCDVFPLFFFPIKIKFLKNYQKCFLSYQKRSFCPRDIQSFVLLSSSFYFFGYCWFYRGSWFIINYYKL